MADSFFMSPLAVMKPNRWQSILHDSLQGMSDSVTHLDFEESFGRTLECWEMSCDQSADLSCKLDISANHKEEVVDAITVVISAMFSSEGTIDATLPPQATIGERPPCYGQEASINRSCYSSTQQNTTETKSKSKSNQSQHKVKLLLSKLKHLSKFLRKRNISK